MSSILIIAYGNPLRSDDGLAWRAADSLEAQLPASKADIRRVHQLAPELAESIGRSEAVIFLDASTSASPESKSGDIHVEKILPKDKDPKGTSAFCHAFSSDGVLALAGQLYGSRADAYSVTMIGENFSHGESLSPGVAACLPKMIERVQTLVQQLLSEGSPTS